MPAQHDHDGEASLRITVPHANSEDAAALFMPNSSAGSGMVLPHQETLSRMTPTNHPATGQTPRCDAASERAET